MRLLDELVVVVELFVRGVPKVLLEVVAERVVVELFGEAVRVVAFAFDVAVRLDGEATDDVEFAERV